MSKIICTRAPSLPNIAVMQSVKCFKTTRMDSQISIMTLYTKPAFGGWRNDRSWGEIDCTTRSSPGHPGVSNFSLIGDSGCPGCPGIARHFLAGADQSSGTFAPWLMICFIVPSHVNGTSQVSPTERQSSWPTVSWCAELHVLLE